MFVWLEDRIDLVKDKRVMLLSNPGLFKVGNAIVATSSTDIVYHVLAEGIDRRVGDRVTCCIDAVIQQRSMYPLFPAREGTPLDLAHLSKAALTERTPDIMILRSRLRPFVRNVQQVLCVNPGYLARGSSKGCYVKVMLNTVRENTQRFLLPHKISAKIVPIDDFDA